MILFLIINVVIIESFQNELKRLNPTMQSIKYGVNDVFTYIDTFHEYNMLWYPA